MTKNKIVWLVNNYIYFSHFRYNAETEQEKYKYSRVALWYPVPPGDDVTTDLGIINITLIS